MQVDPMAVWKEVQRLGSVNLWPGFKPADYPLAMFTGECTLLFGHSHPPQGFSRSERYPGAWEFSGRHPEVAANSTIELGGVATATIMLEKVEGADSGSASMAAVAIHEMFHAFADAHYPLWSVQEMAVISYPKFDAENLQAVYLERMALANALDSLDRGFAASASWIAAFLDIRSRRFRRLEWEHREYENKVELKEGLAYYVEKKALGREKEAAELREFGAPDLVRIRSYSSGRAQAAILDRLMPGWKRILDKWGVVPLELLLEMGLGPKPVQAAALGQAETELSRQAAVAAITALEASYRAKRDHFRDPEVWKIVIEPANPAKLLQLFQYDPMNMLVVAKDEVIYTRMVKVGNDSGSAFLLNPRWQPGGSEGVTLWMQKEGPWQVKKAIVAGFTAEPAPAVQEGTVTLNAEGVTLEFKNARLTRQGKELRILLDSPQRP